MPRLPERRRPAAFFDLDRTLIGFNSGWAYAKAELRQGRATRAQVAQAAVMLGLYHLSLIDMPRAFRRALAHYRGVPEGELAERTRTWFDREVADQLLPGAARALEAHRRDGQPNVLVTNSSSYMAASATASWGLDAWLANRFTTDAGGRLVGDFEEPLCYADGKVTRARTWAQQAGVDLEASTFYTDSLSDLPLLEVVARPRIVNPDPRLRRVARRRGWPILDWSS